MSERTYSVCVSIHFMSAHSLVAHSVTPKFIGFTEPHQPLLTYLEIVGERQCEPFLCTDSIEL